ncbi:hypothetical protein CEUSTIGMA_g11856.t1 [Chlamydomonas eustigma]|uniref:Uncharacterized protein n=1 Tax=Chlamydomonas eustigma TaxID=1157962 RepID=A0A250XN46_9CHLO|nr:hypothetical protein CEUSTIGMA_g11856.t1 [Chlamydomonas eustigma]|eukprot:GAX84436.1 hypothetical protein CEUSTIGMA_g11856.t1 [Chlamydomonas eustigma]
MLRGNDAGRLKPTILCSSRAIIAFCVLFLTSIIDNEAYVVEARDIQTDVQLASTAEMLPALEVASTSYTKGLFETALRESFEGVDESKTLSELKNLLRWLKEAQKKIDEHVPELQNYVLKEVATASIKLATSKFNEVKALEALRKISGWLSSASQKYGHPFTRRLLLGTILNMRISLKRPFSPAMQLAVDRLLLQLFRLHRNSAAQKGRIQFIHISKSGGTNMCMSAEGNGCTTESFSERHNCLIKEFNDEPHWASASGHKYVQYSMKEARNTPWFVNYGKERRVDVTCVERLNLMVQNNWTFYSNEYTLPAGEPTLCKQFVNVIMFREPLTRLASQISWIQKLYMQLHNTTDLSRAFKDRTTGFWERLLPAAVNNYYIRSLLGEQYFSTPLKSVRTSDTELAMLEVMQHDLLLMLEHKEFNDVVLKVGMGWQHSIIDDKIRSSSELKEDVSMPLDFEKMIEHNAPDVKLHQFAEQLQVLDVLLFKFIKLADDNLGLQNISTQPCGYIFNSQGARLE